MSLGPAWQVYVNTGTVQGAWLQDQVRRLIQIFSQPPYITVMDKAGKKAKKNTLQWTDLLKNSSVWNVSWIAHLQLQWLQLTLALCCVLLLHAVTEATLGASWKILHLQQFIILSVPLAVDIQECSRKVSCQSVSANDTYTAKHSDTLNYIPSACCSTNDHLSLFFLTS